MSRSLAPHLGYRESGIVLHTLKYSDNKLIVHMLTRGGGRVTYIATLSSRLRKNIFQPMSVLDFQAVRSRGELHKLTEVSMGLPLHNLFMDISKCTVSMFLSELLYRLLKEPLDDRRMYDFVESSIVVLDSMEVGVGNFHLWFLVHYAYYMGYEFPREYEEGQWLDMKLGSYVFYPPMHSYRIAPQYCSVISRLSSSPLERVSDIELSRGFRVDFLRSMVDYYSYHCDGFGSVRSIDILREVF